MGLRLRILRILLGVLASRLSKGLDHSPLQTRSAAFGLSILLLEALSQCSWSPLTNIRHANSLTDEPPFVYQECHIYQRPSVPNPKSTKRRRGRSTLTP